MRKRETVRHILSNCDRLAVNMYIMRHNNALKVLYWWILHKYKLEDKVRKWSDKEQPQVTRSNKRITIKWNSKVQSNEYTEANRPDMLVIDNEKKRIRIIEMSCPWDKNVNRKEVEKMTKYETIRQELREQYEGYDVKQVNIIVGTLGTITSLGEELGKISKKAKGLAEQIQRVVIMSSIAIVEKFFKRE